MAEKGTTMELHPIFKACCGNPNQPSKYCPSEPWVAGGFVYATDGKIAVRQPTAEPDSLREHGSFPDAASIYKHCAQLEFSPVVLPSEPPKAMMEECAACEGRKVGPFPCDNCQGVGEFSCYECGHRSDCPECDGKGYFGKKGEPCDGCNGTGEQETVVPCRFPSGWTIQACYLRILIEHNAALEIPSALDKPARFTIGDIVGLVMPVIRGAGHTYPTEVTITEAGVVEVVTNG